MAAISTHYGDVRKWILQVIESCDKYDQIFTARRLADKFSAMYPTLDSSLKYSINVEFIHAISDKQHKILNKNYESSTNSNN
jgi:hypothetical protein